MNFNTIFQLFVVKETLKVFIITLGSSVLVNHKTPAPYPLPATSQQLAWVSFTHARASDNNISGGVYWAC